MIYFLDSLCADTCQRSNYELEYNALRLAYRGLPLLSLNSNGADIVFGPTFLRIRRCKCGPFEILDELLPPFGAHSQRITKLKIIGGVHGLLPVICRGKITFADRCQGRTQDKNQSGSNTWLLFFPLS